MIIGWASAFGLTPNEVLYDYSYTNLLLMSAATPQYDDEKPEQWDASLDANDPNNFTDIEEDIIIHDINELTHGR